MDSGLRKLGAVVEHRPGSARRVSLRVLLIVLILAALHFLHTFYDGGYWWSRQGHNEVVQREYDGLPPLSTSYISNTLKPRHDFKNYDEYVQLQLRKTLNPRLRNLWMTRDWRRKVELFSRVFQGLINMNLLKPGDKALCIAARVGQEVLALKEVGVQDSIGVDLVPSPPLVVKGDMHRLPFEEKTFDFAFSNAFDHALFPAMFASEIERTLKPGGVAVLHLSLKQRPDKYSANDLYSIDPLVRLFKNFDLIHMKEVDAFGLDSEIALRKKESQQLDRQIQANLKRRCPMTKLKENVINAAEPLIAEEPLKPWIAFKENVKKIKYLANFSDIRNHTRYVYVDVGARSYYSSIGNWFVKTYPKQKQDFLIYAVEADRSFFGEYLKHQNVKLLPYAAWVKNETLVFGPNPENAAVEGKLGMGRVKRPVVPLNHESNLKSPHINPFKTVQGFDFAEWLKMTFSFEDFVVMKMDIEGTEFDLLPRLVETGAICLVDELFLECHYNRWQRTSPYRSPKYRRTYKECLCLFETLRNNGVLVHQWW